MTLGTRGMSLQKRTILVSLPVAMKQGSFGDLKALGQSLGISSPAVP